MSPDADRRRRAARRAAGLCTTCGECPPVPSRLQCRECIAGGRVRNAAHRRRWERTIVRQRAQRAQYADARGLCRKCCDAPRKPGCVQCVDCLFANSVAKAEWRERRRLAAPAREAA
jgi:hypothetical protein